VKSRGYSNKVNKVVPRTDETLKFVEYIKTRFPNFEVERFLQGREKEKEK
jgi:hypothetical protein